MNTSNILEINKLSKSFEKKAILNSATLTLRQGDTFGLVGLNGAGKTTFIRLILGLLKPDSGTIDFFGNGSATGNKLKRCGVVLDNSGLYGNLSFSENMRFYAAAKGVGEWELNHFLEENIFDKELLSSEKKCKFFSKGEKMQAAIYRAFIGKPELVIMDEPTSGLDFEAYEHFSELVKKFQRNGTAFLISSHSLDTIEELCTNVTVLKNGTLVKLEEESSKLPITVSFVESEHIEKFFEDRKDIECWERISERTYKLILNETDDISRYNLLNAIIKFGLKPYSFELAGQTIKSSYKSFIERK